MPFDNQTLVFKVMNKMFALTDINDFKKINLKCLPETAIELRETYQAVQPGYHMNKKHWNTIEMDGSVSDELIIQWTDDSYKLVCEGLTKKLREELKKM